MLEALIEELALLRRWGATRINVSVLGQRCTVHYVAPDGRQMDAYILGGPKLVRWHQHATEKITRTSYRALRKTRYGLRHLNGELGLLRLRA